MQYFPSPHNPIPITQQFFPELINWVQGPTADLHRKLKNLSSYAVHTASNASFQGWAKRPYTLEPDGFFGLALFQRFSDLIPNANETPDYLAYSSGDLFDSEGRKDNGANSNSQIGFNISHFQTALFKNYQNRKSRLFSIEAYRSISYFDWRAIFITYYEQALFLASQFDSSDIQLITIPIMMKTDDTALMQACLRREKHPVNEFEFENVRRQQNISRLNALGYLEAGKVLGKQVLMKPLSSVVPIPSFQEILSQQISFD